MRDARATAHSWRRPKAAVDRPETELMPTLSTVRSAGLWLLWNGVTEAVWHRRRYLRVRYEDLVDRPDAELRRILAWLGVGGRTPLPDGGVVDMRATHSVAGNPDRMRVGEVVVRGDDEWRRQPARDRAVTTALTLPLLARYHYLRPAVA